MGVYVLQNEDRKSVADIFDNFPKLEAAEKYKKALDEMTNKACDELQSYFEDEYILRFEEVIEKQARHIVECLLRGEDLQAFGLRLRETWNNKGEFSAYDPQKIRASIVKDFANVIQTAEMHELTKENERLKKDNDYYRQIRA